MINLPIELKTFNDILCDDGIEQNVVHLPDVLQQRKGVDTYLSKRYQELFKGKKPSDERVIELLYLQVVPAKQFEKYLSICFIAAQTGSRRPANIPPSVRPPKDTVASHTRC